MLHNTCSTKCFSYNYRSIACILYLLFTVIEQVPEGSVLKIREPKTKMIYRVSLNHTRFQYELRVKLGTNKIPANEHSVNVTVIYNDCTDSDTPDWLCKECQITFRGKQLFRNMSFVLYYKHDNKIHRINLAKIDIVQAAIAKDKIPTTIFSSKYTDTYIQNLRIIYCYEKYVYSSFSPALFRHYCD